MKAIRTALEWLGIVLLLTAALAVGALVLSRLDLMRGDAPIYRSQQ